MRDISFVLVNVNRDQFIVSTSFEGGSYWSAIEIATDDYTLGGDTFGFSVTFSPVVQNDVPKPSTLGIFALGLLGLAARRSKKQ